MAILVKVKSDVTIMWGPPHKVQQAQIKIQVKASQKGGQRHYIKFMKCHVWLKSQFHTLEIKCNHTLEIKCKGKVSEWGVDPTSLHCIRITQPTTNIHMPIRLQAGPVNFLMQLSKVYTQIWKGFVKGTWWTFHIICFPLKNPLNQQLGMYAEFSRHH